jgi:hypothetical protein
MLRSDLGRLVRVLTAPKEAFEEIRNRPSFAVALAALVVCAALALSVVLAKTDFSAFFQQSLQHSPGPEDRAAMEKNLATAYRFRWVASAASVLVLGPAGYLAAALFFWLAFRLQGASLAWKSSLAVTVHGLLPGCIQAALTVAVALVLKTLPFGRASLVSSNLAAFSTESTSAPLFTLLRAMDLFSFWAIALLCVGFSIAASVSRRRAAATIVACWALYVAGKVLLAGA